MTLPLPASWLTGQSWTAAAEDNLETVITNIGNGTLVIPRRPTTTGAASYTISAAYNVHVFTGSSPAAWTLPPVSGNTGARLELVNRGSATVTVTRAGSNQIQSKTALVTSVPLERGFAMRLVCDGTYWLVMALSTQTGVTPKFDAAATVNTASLASNATKTWSHVVGAGKVLGVIVLIGGPAAFGTPFTAAAVKTVSLGGVALTFRGMVTVSTGSGLSSEQIWFFAGYDIPAGTQTASVKLVETGNTFAGDLVSLTYQNAAWAASVYKVTAGSYVAAYQLTFGGGIFSPRSTTAPGAAVVACTVDPGGCTYASVNYRAPGVGDVFATGPDPVGSAWWADGGGGWGMASLEILGSTPAGPYLDAVGPGGTGSFTHTATAGADVFVWVFAVGTLTGVNYDGAAMTLVDSQTLNNSAGNGKLALYRKTGVAGGAKTVAFVGGATVVANAVSYLNVTAVGAAAKVFATLNGWSQGPLSCADNQLILQAFAAGYTTTETDLAGWNLYLVDGLSINQSIAQANAPITFTGDTNSVVSTPSAGVAVVLS